MEVARNDVAEVLDARRKADFGGGERDGAGLDFVAGGEVTGDVVLEGAGVGFGGDDGDGGTVAGEEPRHVHDRNDVAGGEQRKNSDSELFIFQYHDFLLSNLRWSPEKMAGGLNLDSDFGA